MEPTAGGGGTLNRCDICRCTIDLESSHYSWSPWPGLLIERDLCEECGNEFLVKTRSIEDWAKAQTHSRFIDWENKTRVDKDIKRRQLRMPGV
jgi:hypothetical protein